MNVALRIAMFFVWVLAAFYIVNLLDFLFYGSF